MPPARVFNAPWVGYGEVIADPITPPVPGFVDHSKRTEKLTEQSGANNRLNFCLKRTRSTELSVDFQDV